MSTLQCHYDMSRCIRELLHEASAQSDPKSNQRRHDRHAYVMRGRGRFLRTVQGDRGGQRKFWVWAKDLSRSGISFVRRFKLTEGEVIELNFVNRQGRLMTLCARIVRCRPLDFPYYELGAEFCDRPGEA